MTFATSKFYKFLPAATMSMAMQFLVSMSDFIICGNIIGETGLAAMNLMQGFFEISSFVSLIVIIGACVHFSTESGAFHLRRAKGYFTLGVIATVLIGILTTIIYGIVRVPVLKSFGASQEVFETAAEYCLWYLPYVALSPLYRYLSMMCAADGNARLSTIAYIVQFVLTASGSVLFTYLCGIKGCAFSAWMSVIFSLAILMCHFRKKECTLGFNRHFRVTDLLRIMQTSIGDASKNVGKAILCFSLNAFVIAKFGSEYLSVLAVVMMTISISDVFDGIGNAIQPLISVYVGEKNSLLTRRIMRIAIKLSLCSGGFMALLIAIFPQLVLKMAGVENPEIVSQAVLAVRLVSVSLVGLAIVLLFNSYFTFIHHDALSTMLTMLALCVCPLALAVPAGAMFGMNGMWVGFAIAPMAAVSIVAAYLVWKYGKDKFPLLLGHERDKNLRVFDLTLNPDEICATAHDIEKHLLSRGIAGNRASRAALLTEETFMVVRDRNAGKKVLGEITVDLNGDRVNLVLRDDGEIFDITDVDAQVSSLRVYLVSNLMTQIPHRRNLITTGFNRNTFRL